MTEFLQHLGKDSLKINNEQQNDKNCKLQKFPNGVTYLMNYQEGFQLEIQNNILKNVYLYGNHDKQFKPYKGVLPFGITFTMCNAHIVAKFGEPTSKQGGGPINIGISYDHIGIEITFQTKTWDQPNVAIDQIILYEPVNQTICGICKKNGDLRCGQCKLVYYCGVDCQKTHWKQHKGFCQ
ncbi:unnamed protein product [Paramecium primaurelia]|uniref:MYND-type domain-containing protein n=1 Tax=Paramecium primaurelia TaxID=5886 RepID=A0A8S1LMZ6_PARPR|nr:unnamed protein product [Paramecium primaurelia]